jgi:hypothetical protein
VFIRSACSKVNVSAAPGAAELTIYTAAQRYLGLFVDYFHPSRNQFDDKPFYTPEHRTLSPSAGFWRRHAHAVTGPLN